MAVAPAGYSGKPLAAKLGIGPGMTVLAIGAPSDYAAWLAPLPSAHQPSTLAAAAR